MTRIQRYLLIMLGIIFVGIGFIGIILPGLPTTPFLLLAAGCFAKSSPRLYSWLHNHKILGPILYHWKNDRSIPKNAKRTAIVMILVGAVFTYIMVEHLYLKAALLATMLIPLIIVSRLKVAPSTIHHPQAD